MKELRISMAIKQFCCRGIFLLAVFCSLAMVGIAHAQSSYEITATGIHFTNGPAGIAPAAAPRGPPHVGQEGLPEWSGTFGLQL